MPGDELLYATAHGIARLRLNRPEKLNALTPSLMAAIWDRVEEAERDDEVRVIIISGEGRCFSSGGDLTWIVDEPPLDPEAYLNERGENGWVKARARSATIWDGFWEVSKPIIAQVHGYCLAGACEIAFFADLTVASDDALFGEPESKHGWVAASMWLLGPKIARELFLFGDPVTAHDALRMGMINKVVPRDRLEAEATALAERLITVPAASLAMVKRTGLRYYRSLGYPAFTQSVGEMAAYARAIQGFADNEIGFNQMVKEQGLKAALDARDRRHAE